MAYTLYDSSTLLFKPGVYKATKSYFLKPTGATGCLTQARATTSGRFNQNGIVEEDTLAVNVPCVDYNGRDPRYCPQLVVDKQRTNHIKDSNDIAGSGTSWLTTNVTIDSQITAPNGLTEGNVIQYAASTADNFRQQNLGLTNGTVYEFVLWVKIPEGHTGNKYRVRHYDGTTTSAIAQPVFDNQGWVRYAYEFTASGAANEFISLYNAAGGDVHSGQIAVWGAMVVVKGSHLHIKTTTAAVTRNADTCSYANLQSASVFSATAGTIMADIRLNIGTGNAGVLKIGNSGSTNYIEPEGQTIKLVSGATTQNTGNILTDNGNDEFDGKLAISWNATSCLISINGSTADASALTSFNPGDYTDLSIRSFVTPSFVRKLAAWNSKLTQDQLNLLTS